jgi:hypothetical protein
MSALKDKPLTINLKEHTTQQRKHNQLYPPSTAAVSFYIPLSAHLKFFGIFSFSPITACFPCTDSEFTQKLCEKGSNLLYGLAICAKNRKK